MAPLNDKTCLISGEKINFVSRICLHYTPDETAAARLRLLRYYHYVYAYTESVLSGPTVLSAVSQICKKEGNVKLLLIQYSLLKRILNMETYVRKQSHEN